MIRTLHGVTIVDVAHGDGVSRPEARLRIRAAALEAAAGLLGVAATRLTWHPAPGSPPQLLVDRQASGLRLSITHAARLSLAAMRFGAPVGIDLMEVEDVPDWRAVTLDYLGPQMLAHLAALPEVQRMPALAHAWTAREAALKSHGLQLQEWRADSPPCTLFPLHLWPGHAACLALADRR